MKELIIEFFGEYTPTTYEVITSEGAINYIPNGVAGLDIEYVSGVLLFAIFLYCTFKLIGGVIKNA